MKSETKTDRPNWMKFHAINIPWIFYFAGTIGELLFDVERFHKDKTTAGIGAFAMLSIVILLSLSFTKKGIDKRVDWIAALTYVLAFPFVYDMFGLDIAVNNIILSVLYAIIALMLPINFLLMKQKKLDVSLNNVA